MLSDITSLNRACFAEASQVEERDSSSSEKKAPSTVISSTPTLSIVT